MKLGLFTAISHKFNAALASGGGAGATGYGAGVLTDFFFVSVPGEDPCVFYTAKAGSPQSSLMKIALDRNLGLPVVSIKAKPGTKDRYPELGVFKG